MQDPSQMSDEELDKALEASLEPEDTNEEVAVESPEVETPQEVEEEPQEEVEAQAEEPKTEEPAQPSRREQLRIQQLLKKYGPPQERPEPQADLPDYRQMIDAPEEVYQQLEESTRSYGQTASSQALKQVESVKWETRLEIDAPKVASTYPQLNKDSDQFNPALADSINSEYLQYVGFDPRTGLVDNPGIRYADFVEARYEQAKMIAREEVQKSTQNIAKQAATTGLRPDGSSANRLNLNKDPGQMSDEELDAVIAQAGLASKKRK